MPDSNDLKNLDSQLKKTIISAESFKRGSSVAFDPSKNILNIQKTLSKLVENVKNLVNIVSNFGKIVNNNSRKITSLKNISKTQSSIASGENIGAKLPGSSTSNVEDSIATITKSVTSIAEILAGKKKSLDNAAAFDRRKAEQEKRGLAEDKLEKRFEGLKSEAEKVISPVKSILDRIIDFFVTVFLGRVVYKLLEWFGDPKNADKVRAIGRFLGDHWPKLLALYITFETSFGRFALGLTKAVASGAIKLGFAIAKLLAAKKVKGAMGAARFLGGGKGKLLAGVLGTGAALGGAYAVTQGLKGGGEEQKTQGLAGGGYVKPRFAAFSGGGLNLKGMLGGASMGAMLGPLGMLLGGAAGSGMSSGFVSGEKGVDKVPAMLTDGEFVMSTGAVAKYGVDTLEGMNAAGGGTNKPKIMNGTTYAAGGGFIGDSRKHLTDVYNWFDSQGINPQDPRTWSGSGGKFAAGVMSGLNKGINQIGNFGESQANKANNYLASGGLEKDVTKLMQSGTQFGTGLYDQALNIGNKALSDIQSGKFQKQAMSMASQASELPKKTGLGIFDTFKNIGTNETYKENTKKVGEAQDKMITMGDNFIKNLPDGPFKEIADKGLIPIPSGNATMMRNLTFIKALLGPAGRGFKILSNKQVDEMRRKTIEKTMGKSGLIVDPKTGEVRMNWNQEDINKAAKGGGAYTDDLGPGGSAFNSILGRFVAKTEGKENMLYTDDRYNFNKTVAEYAEMAKQGLAKGSVSDATYFGASMLGRFAQDIGWLNQRALGSRIEIGKIDRSTLDAKTGKRKTSKQIASDQEKMKQEAANIAKQRVNKEKLEAKRPWWDKMGMFGGGSRIAQNQAKQNQVAKTKPKSASVAQSTKTKPKVTVIKSSAPQRRNVRGGGSSTKTPSFSATTNGMRSKQETLGLMR